MVLVMYGRINCRQNEIAKELDSQMPDYAIMTRRRFDGGNTRANPPDEYAGGTYV